MSYPSIGPRAAALAVFGFFLLNSYALPLGVAAQQPLPGVPTVAPLQGVVVQESTGQAVEVASVSVVGTGVEVRTGRYGAFAFPDVEVGIMSLRVTAPGYITVVQQVEVKEDGIVFVQFRLPSVSAVLSELMVGVHRNRSAGDPLTAADLLAIKVPSARVSSGGVGDYDYLVRLRGGATSITQNVEPLILIDGVVIARGDDAFKALSMISAADVLDIEVLRGPATAFLYPLAANGVVLVKTRAGRGR